MHLAPPSFRDDLARAIPYVLWPNKLSLTNDEAFVDWALHIQGMDWTENHYWPAPLEYEKLYHNQLNKSAWLTEVATLLNLITPFLSDFASFQRVVSNTDLWKHEHLRQKAYHNALTGAARLQSWLRSKQKSAVAQFVTTMRTLHFSQKPHYVEGKEMYHHALNHTSHSDEIELCNILYDAFEQEIQAELGAERLRILSYRLASIGTLRLIEFEALEQEHKTLPTLLQKLPGRFPQLIWNGIAGDNHTPTTVSQYFWNNLLYSIEVKLYYISRAIKLINAETTEEPKIIPLEHIPALASPASPFAKLLLNFTEEQLTKILREEGLIDDDGKATKAASAQLWCGIIHALRDANPPRIYTNNTGSAQALKQAFGATVSASTLGNGPGKAGSNGYKLKMRVLSLLKNL